MRPRTGKRSPHTRRCRTCNDTHHRFDLVIKDNGAVVCPRCGEVLAIQHALRADVDHVLVPATNRGNSSGAVHQPSANEPLQPECAARGMLGRTGDEYQPRDPAKVPDSHTVCANCWVVLASDDDRQSASDRNPDLDARLAGDFDPDDADVPPMPANDETADDDLVADGAGTTGGDD